MSTLRSRLAFGLAAVAMAACGTLLSIDPDAPPGPTTDAAVEGATGIDGAVTGDGGTPPDASLPDGATVGDAGPLLVFVSEGSTGGDMRFGLFSVDAGRDNADAVCKAEATVAGKPGTYLAWLSTENTNLDNAIDRLPAGRAWALRSGTVVFDSKAKIPTGPSVPIIETAAGNMIDLRAGDLATVYTGTNSAGQKVGGNSCQGWSSAGGGGVQAQIGQTDDLVHWTASIMVNCDQPRRIYCFQQQ